ncbi:hypothetical protein AB0I68_33225 [Streptomyces sp. NPDC050448]|uniref:hypothetical protein n=1 Tax=Streptomyces sp. NPDC050448 TaxID=3155404 RepID=UPI003423C0B3
MVDHDVAGFDYSEGGWNFREERLGQFARWVLHGQLLSAESYPRHRRVYRVIDDKRVPFRRSLWWTSRQSVDAQTKHELMRQRQEAAKAERDAREKAEEEAREREALETANAWWCRLSKAQSEELFDAVVDRAWREEKLWVEVPETPRMSREYACGVPLSTRGKRGSRTLNYPVGLEYGRS